jgi:outer membrane protein
MKTKFVMLAVAAVVGALALSATMNLPIVLAQSAGSPAATAPSKVGILDVRQAIGNTAEGKQAAAELQSRYAPRQAELDAIRKQIDDIQNRLQTGQRTLSDDEKRRLSIEADRLSRLGQRKQESLREDLQDEEQDLLQRIGPKMREVVDRYARENAIALILDSSSQTSGIVYMSNAIDITQDIIRLYDAAYPLKPAAGQPAKQPQPGQPAKQPAKPPQL